MMIELRSTFPVITDVIRFCHIYIRNCNIVFPSLPLSYKKLDGYLKDDVQYGFSVGFLLVLNYY